MLIRDMRENFHVHIRQQNRKSELSNKRNQYFTNLLSQKLKVKPSIQGFKEVISQFSLKDMLDNANNIDNLQLICYLTLVEDYECNLYLANNGVCNTLFETAKKIIKEYQFNEKSEFKLNYCLSGIANLIEQMDREANIPYLIEEAIKLVDRYYSVGVCTSLLFLIDVSNRIATQETIQFIFSHLTKPDVTQFALEALINVQQSQNEIAYTEDNVKSLFYVLEENNQYNNFKVAVVLSNISKSNRFILESFLREHNALCKIEALFEQNDLLPLLELLREMQKSNITIYSKSLLEKLRMQHQLNKLVLYMEILSKMIRDGQVEKREIVEVINDSLRSEFHSQDSRNFLEEQLLKLSENY